MTTTLKQIKDFYCSVFKLDDPTIIDLILAIAFDGQLAKDPIWLMIVAAPSSGKTELINILSKIPFVHEVSDLTENTFLSGMGDRDGRPSSLLHRIGSRGVLLMADYTTLLSMRSEKRDVIAGQMRRIYDGELNKETGNGKSPEWKGKINFIGGVTDMIFSKEGDQAGMGRRSICYVLPEQDRMLTLRQSKKNDHDIIKKREKLKDMVADFMEGHRFGELDELNLPDLDDDLSEELMVLSDFSTRARTPTTRDYQGKLRDISDIEMPMRVSRQLHRAGQLMKYIAGDDFGEKHKKILYKIAFDNIPKLRKQALFTLATYRSSTTKGLAQLMGYPSSTAVEWLQDLNSIGLVERTVETVGNMDKYILKRQYRDLVRKYNDLEDKEFEDLKGDESEELDRGSLKHDYDSAYLDEEHEKHEKIFDSLFKATPDDMPAQSLEPSPPSEIVVEMTPPLPSTPESES